MQCEKCENIQKDPNTGMLICLTCGNVVEESQVVNALEFDEDQKAAGTFMDLNKPTYFYPGGRNTLSQMVDPLQRNINKTFKLIERVAKILTITESVVKYAKKIYTIASNKKFTQGRNTKHIVGAILYLACRYNKTSHLLIDFSEVLRINLFIIGSLYIKLVKLLGITIQIIDPSLYMHRFFNKFNFGNNSKDVEKTALKILQFMKRDWITTGRRPSGLCGACILIAAKLHKLDINIKILSDVVHVCPQTIQNRIEEFSLTKVASMTVEQFKTFKESHFYPGADPPAFLKNMMEENEKKGEKEEEIITEKIENGATNKKEEKKLENGSSNISYNDNDNREDLNIKKYESMSLRKNSSNNLNNELKLSTKAKSENLKKNNLNLRSSKNEGKSLAEEQLSVIPGNEVYKYIYSDDEYGIRKQFWEIMFKDWIEQQKEKEEKEAKDKKTHFKEPRKRSKKMTLKSGVAQKTPFEAIKSSNKLGRRTFNNDNMKFNLGEENSNDPLENKFLNINQNRTNKNEDFDKYSFITKTKVNTFNIGNEQDEQNNNGFGGMGKMRNNRPSPGLDFNNFQYKASGYKSSFGQNIQNIEDNEEQEDLNEDMNNI